MFTCMVETPPGYDTPGAKVEGFWDHPHQGKWVLYTYDDPETGERQYFELHENKDWHHEINDVDKFYSQVSLLERNRSAYNSAKGSVF